MLLVADLKAIEERVLPVDVLGDGVAGILLDGGEGGGREVARREVGEVQTAGDGREQLGCGQLLDEDSCLDHAERVEEVFIEQVVVVGVLRPQCGIADADCDGAGGAVLSDVRHELVGVGTRDPRA